MDTAIKFGFVKHQIRVEFQNFTPSLRYTSRPQLADRLCQGVMAQQRNYHHSSTNSFRLTIVQQIPRGRRTCFNGRNEPLYKHTSRGGNTHGMQSIRNILHKQTPYPYTITRTIAKANSLRKLIPVLWKNYLQTHGTAIGTKMAVAFSSYIDS